MQKIDGRPVFAATDLVGFLACAHRLALERAMLAELVPKPMRKDPAMDRIAMRGDQHEARYLADLEAQGLRIVSIDKDGSAVAPLSGEVPVPVPYDAGPRLREAAAETIEAMRSGADVVYQGTFFNGRWRGHADFLLRRDHAPDEPDSAFGPWHYEVADTKLARHVTAGAILQICSYVDQLTAIQGRQPELLYVVLGGRDREKVTQRVDEVMAYYRRVKAEFEASVGLGPVTVPDPVYPPVATYPEPVEHCEVCRWAADCAARRRADDDLSRVAGASSRHRAALKARGIRTRTGLGSLALPAVPKVEGVGRDALARIREQARLQVESDGLATPRWELLALDRDKAGEVICDRGLLGLPPPSHGDLFLDLEGDPFALEEGVDYLFGILEPGLEETDPRWLADPWPDGGSMPLFHALWSIGEDGMVSLEAEKAAFERTIDLILDRRRNDPDMHVYHYAAYEHTALGRLAQRYGTRETEVDDLLRGKVLVDLYRVVHQGLRIGVESYSIKRLEPLYGFVRTQDMKDANSSIVAFEEWLELAPDKAAVAGPKILDDIVGYNRDDVISTLRLRDWLEARREDLRQRERIDLPRPAPPKDGEGATAKAQDLEVAALAERLTQGVPVDPAVRALDPVADGRWMLAQLLGWHRREERAGSWRFYALMGMSDEELIDEREPLAGLEPSGDGWEVGGKAHQVFSFPEQQHGLERGTEVHDPAENAKTGKVVVVDEAARTVELEREGGWGRLPTALVPMEWPRNKALKGSLFRLGTRVAQDGLTSSDLMAPDDEPAPAYSLLMRARLPGLGPDGDLRLAAEPALAAAVRLATAIRGGILPIQGPPGSGKTFTGAHMIVRLVQAGRTVGVVANSHKVIGNLLDKVDEVSAELLAAAEIARSVRIGQKPKEGAEPTCAKALKIKDNARLRRFLDDGSLDVVGATAWAWASGDVSEAGPAIDVLFVDEAGQMSLANTVAAAPAARALVLLGDPQQLDQPTQGSHPPGAERSALAHILRDRATIEPSQGLFLERTWRLHPDICDYTSEAFYAGKLAPIEGLDRQVVAGPEGHALVGTGVRYLPVEHHGNATESAEEAEVIARLVTSLVDGGSTWTDRHGKVRPVVLDDIVVVAPYNAHVAEIGLAFERAGYRDAFVGTVDKFQGQERPISIYAMGTSAPEDAPRGMEFLYSLNRLNVATSRARCVTAVVCSPALLRVACRTPRQMRLANGLCLAVEAAERHAAAGVGTGAEPPPPEPPPDDGGALLLFPDLGETARRRRL